MAPVQPDGRVACSGKWSSATEASVFDGERCNLWSILLGHRRQCVILPLLTAWLELTPCVTSLLFYFCNFSCWASCRIFSSLANSISDINHIKVQNATEQTRAFCSSQSRRDLAVCCLVVSQIHGACVPSTHGRLPNLPFLTVILLPCKFNFIFISNMVQDFLQELYEIPRRKYLWYKIRNRKRLIQ